MALDPTLQDFIEPGGGGVIYEGPELTPQEEAAVRARPKGTRIMPPPPVDNGQTQAARQAALAAVPGAQSMEDVAAWNRVAARDVPGTSVTLPGVSRPPIPSEEDQLMTMGARMGANLAQVTAAVESQRRFQAQRGYQADLANGMSSADAITKWGPLLFAGPKGAGAMPKMAQPPMSQQDFRARVHQGPNGEMFYESAPGKIVHIPRPATKAPVMDTITEKIEKRPPTVAVPGRPASAGWSPFGIPIIPPRAAVPAVPADPGAPARTVTRRVPSGTAVTAPARGEVTGDMEAQARAAIKAGASESAVRKRYKELTGADLD